MSTDLGVKWTQLAQILTTLYRGRRDTWVKQDIQTKELTRVFGEPVSAEVFARHLGGEFMAAVYYLLPGNTCHMMTLDFDLNDLEVVKLFYNYVNQKWGLTPAVSTSKGKGFHMDFFFADPDPVPAAKARAFLLGVKRALQHEASSWIELFPHADALRDEDGIGKGCMLPLNNYYLTQVDRTWYLDMPSGEPIRDAAAGIVRAFKTSRITISRLDAIIKELDAGGLLQIRQKALIPDMFPEAAKQWQEEEARRKLKAEQESLARKAQMFVMPVSEADLTEAAALLSACGEEVMTHLYETICDRIHRFSLPCVSGMFYGASQGTRDEVCLRLIIHFRNEFNLDKAMIQFIMLEWNRRNHPPLEEKLIIGKINYVFEKDYKSYGCDSPAIQQYCHGMCPFMTPEHKMNRFRDMLKRNPVIELTKKTMAAELNTVQVSVSPTVAAAAAIPAPISVIAPVENMVMSASGGVGSASILSGPAADVTLYYPTPAGFPESVGPTDTPAAVALNPEIVDDETDIPVVANADPGLQDMLHQTLATTPAPVSAEQASAMGMFMMPSEPMAVMQKVQTLADTASQTLTGFNAATITNNQADAYSNPAADSLIANLGPGFTIMINERRLRYDKDGIGVEVLGVLPEKAPSLKVHAEVSFNKILLGSDRADISTNRGRKRLFQPIADAANNPGLAEVLGLAIYQQFVRAPELRKLLMADGKPRAVNQLVQAGPNPLTGKEVIRFNNSESTAISGAQFARASVEYDRQLRSGVDYHRQSKTLFMFAVHAVNEVLEEKDPTTGAIIETEIEAKRPVIVTSRGEVIHIPNNLTMKKGAASLPIQRLPKPHDGLIFPPVTPASFMELENRWSTKDILAFMNNAPTNTVRHVSLAKLAQDLRDLYKKYTHFRDDEDYAVNALWDIGTYLFYICPAFPLIYLNGAAGAGKTTICGIKSNVCFNALFTVNTSDSALYRTISLFRSTYIMDEREDVKRKHDNNYASSNTLSLLNASYKEGPKIPRTDTENAGATVNFSPYGPKVIANINGCDPVLWSRTIHVTMTRSAKGVADMPPKEEMDVIYQQIRDDIYTYIMNGGAVKYDKLINSAAFHKNNPLINRSRELWAPLMALAYLINDEGDPSFLNDITEAANKAENIRGVINTADTTLLTLAALRDLKQENSPDKVRFKEVRKRPTISFLLYDIVVAASAGVADPEEFVKRYGRSQVVQALQTLGLTTSAGSGRSKREILRVIRNKDTGNLEEKKFKTDEISIPVALLEEAILTNLRGETLAGPPLKRS